MRDSEFREEFHRHYGAVLTRLVTKLTQAKDCLLRAADQMEGGVECVEELGYVEKQMNAAHTHIDRALWTCRELPNGDNIVDHLAASILGAAIPPA